MSIQYFKKERGGAGLSGYDVPFIFRDPPKSYHTQKYEPVDIADVTYMFSPDNPYGDPTRINEGIQMYARGQNPMVEVSYQNAGAASQNTSLGSAQVSNPYKVEVVRPPLFPLEVLQPISAPRMHQNYSITTNPAIFPMSVAGEFDKSKVRLMTSVYTSPAYHLRTNLVSEKAVTQPRSDLFNKQLSELLSIETTPTKSYDIASVRDYSKSVVRTKDVLPISSAAPMSFTNITVYDPKTNTNIQIEANIKQKNAIAVTAAVNGPLTFNTNDGQIIRLKDYEYKVVNSAQGNTEMTIYVRQDDIKLDRTSPLYAAEATLSMSGIGYGAQRAMADKISLASILPLFSATASVKLNNYDERALRASNEPDKFKLTMTSPQTSVQTGKTLVGNKGYNENRNDKTRDLIKQASSGTFGSSRNSSVLPSPFLAR
jgi:hypothetical protein